MAIYVSMEDRVISGMMSNQRDAFFDDSKEEKVVVDKLILHCANEEEAQIVADNAEARSDMTNIKIHRTDETPLYRTGDTDNKGRIYHVSHRDKGNWPKFYEPGRFAWLASQRETC